MAKKAYKVSQTSNNYNIQGITFISWYGCSQSEGISPLVGNQIVSDKGNKLFIGSDNKIYELENNNLTEYGALPIVSGILKTSTPYNYQQNNNCILVGYNDNNNYKVIYSLDYGKHWNNFSFTDNLPSTPSRVLEINEIYGYAYMNNAIGIIVNLKITGQSISIYTKKFLYTDDFLTVKEGFTSIGISGSTFVPYIVGTLNNKIVVNFDSYVYLMSNFTETEYSFAVIGTSFNIARKIDNNAVILYNSSDFSEFKLFIYNNGQIQATSRTYHTNTTTISDTFICYKDDYLYVIDNGRIRKINISTNNEQIVAYTFDNLIYYSKLLNNFIVYACASAGANEFIAFNIDLMEFLLFDKSEELNSYLITAINDKINHFKIYMTDEYTETISDNINPQDRTTIYANDYSTIMGSQVLENAVRSVNHKINTISIENNGLLSQKILECDKVSLFDSAYNYKKQNYDIKQIFTQTFNVKLILDKPMVDNINNYTFELSYKNQKLYYNRLADGHLENIILLASPQTRVMSDTSIKNYYNIDYVEDSTYLTDSIGEPHTEFVNQVTNIVKIDDYTITATVNAIIEYGHYKSGQIGVSNDVIDVKSATEITLSVKGKVMKETYSDFVFSIDLDGNNNPIQNNPLTRTDNELFSLSNSFFETQANAIIQDNKDGRMVLTVNSTSDLGLYIGKELTVMLKDGTLANNGATFEVVGIKEKFTGINWKQTYTLKEKKSST